MGSRRAGATATAVLPTPVGPAITTSRGLSLMTPVYVSEPVLPVPFELAADVGERHPAHDRPPVRAEVGRLGRPELRDEPLHLLALERHVRLHRRAAGHEREGAVERGLPRLRPADLVRGGLDEPLGLVTLQQRGHGADDHRLAAEALDGETQALERLAPALEEGARGGAEVHGLLEEESLRRGRPARELPAEALEDDALVGHVLVEEQDLPPRGRAAEQSPPPAPPPA